jgi:hypothetical protein
MRVALHRQAEGSTPVTSMPSRQGGSRRSIPNFETLGYSQTSLRDEDEILVVAERARVLPLRSQSVILKPGRGQHGKTRDEILGDITVCDILDSYPLMHHQPQPEPL